MCVPAAADHPKVTTSYCCATHSRPQCCLKEVDQVTVHVVHKKTTRCMWLLIFQLLSIRFFNGWLFQNEVYHEINIFLLVYMWDWIIKDSVAELPRGSWFSQCASLLYCPIWKCVFHCIICLQCLLCAESPDGVATEMTRNSKVIIHAHEDLQLIVMKTRLPQGSLLLSPSTSSLSLLSVPGISRAS